MNSQLKATLQDLSIVQHSVCTAKTRLQLQASLDERRQVIARVNALMQQPTAAVSGRAVIREMDADEIKTIALEGGLTDEEWREAARQYWQLTGKHLTNIH